MVVIENGDVSWGRVPPTFAVLNSYNKCLTKTVQEEVPELLKVSLEAERQHQSHVVVVGDGDIPWVARYVYHLRRTQ